jgi:hypothetical protein
VLVVVAAEAGELVWTQDVSMVHICINTKMTYVFPAVVAAADPVLPLMVTFGLIQLQKNDECACIATKICTRYLLSELVLMLIMEL